MSFAISQQRWTYSLQYLLLLQLLNEFQQTRVYEELPAYHNMLQCRLIDLGTLSIDSDLAREAELGTLSIDSDLAREADLRTLSIDSDLAREADLRTLSIASDLAREADL